MHNGSTVESTHNKWGRRRSRSTEGTTKDAISTDDCYHPSSRANYNYVGYHTTVHSHIGNHAEQEDEERTMYIIYGDDLYCWG